MTPFLCPKTKCLHNFALTHKKKLDEEQVILKRHLNINNPTNCTFYININYSSNKILKKKFKKVNFCIKI